MSIKSSITSLLCFLSVSMSANIYCPNDIVLQCDDDIYYLPVTGKPTVIGYPSSMAKYTDVSFLDQCKTGYLNRIWYLDINQDGIFQSTEQNCTQKITINYIPSEIVVTFPDNKVYTCKEEITLDKPEWVQGPCDVMGYSVEDAVFEVVSDACYKIFRKFTVLNWCKYKPTDPNWDGTGIWTYTQVIKVLEKTPPTILDCTNKTIGVEGDCKAPITLTNKAVDDANCASQLLTWQVEVDLWADGKNDYIYGVNEIGDFKLNPVKNNEEIKITLPIRVGVGKHKVYWSVKDQCGNFKTCYSFIETKDLKSPTPYMHYFLTSAFEGNVSSLKIPANCFNIGSFDNCTLSSKLKYSFSQNVKDTLRTVDCTNPGFQFYTIYVTDENGNFEIVEAFMLVFDNGSCSFSGNFGGRAVEANGKPMENVEMSLSRRNISQGTFMTDPTGIFECKDISLYSDYQIRPNYTVAYPNRVNIADLKLLTNYILGKDKLVNFQFLAADINGDQKIKVSDLEMLRSQILRPNTVIDQPWAFAVDVDTIPSIVSLPSISKVFDIMKFDGSIDFKAVYKGDITGANSIGTSPRSTLEVKQNLVDGVVEYNAVEDAKCAGLQITLNVPVDVIDDIVVTSPYFDIKENMISIDKVNHTIRILSTNDFEVTAGTPVLRILTKGSNDVYGISLSPTSLALLDNYNIAFIKVQNEIEKSNLVQIQPNPCFGTFELSRNDANVIRILDTHGRSVAFNRNGSYIHLNGSAGIHFIEIESQGQKEIKKLVVY